MKKHSKTSFPKWGNFIYYADEDVLSIGVLIAASRFLLAFYHSTQAIEKYLKALFLSILDPDGKILTWEDIKKWLQTHELDQLALYCSGRYPFYKEEKTLSYLKELSKYNQFTRYPWTMVKNVLSFDEFFKLEKILLNLRNDIPIEVDDYPLGIAVRGFFYRAPDRKINDWTSEGNAFAVEYLRKIFPRLNEFVRWPTK
jgi:HEPN domain-containing protein